MPLDMNLCSPSSLQDVLNNLGSSELDEDDLMLDLDLSDDQRHRHGNFVTLYIRSLSDSFLLDSFNVLVPRSTNQQTN